jgi:hypothetical protein
VSTCVNVFAGEACLLALCSGIQSTIEYSQSTQAILSRNVPHLVPFIW